MKNCPYCGAQLQENAQFCLFCMRTLTEKRIIVPKRSHIKLILSLCTVLLAAVTLICGAFVMPSLFGSEISIADGDSLSVQKGTSSSAEGSQTSSASEEGKGSFMGFFSDLFGGNSDKENLGSSMSENTSAQSENITSSQGTSSTASAPSVHGQTSSSASSATGSSSVSSTAQSNSAAASTVEESYTTELTFELNSAGTEYAVTGISSTAVTEIIIPKAYNGKPVTAIKDKAFYNNRKITKVVIPGSVKTVGESAFESCLYITELSLGEGIETIKSLAFRNCDYLTSVTIPASVKYACSSFISCSKLETVILSDGLRLSGDFVYMFEECTSIDTVTIPDGNTEVPPFMFSKCTGLKTVVLPKSVKILGNEAFSSCTLLKNIDLTYIQVLDERCIFQITLKELYLSKDLTYIGPNFACELVTDIYYPGTMLQWNNIDKHAYWDYFLSNTTVHCSDGDIKL